METIVACIGFGEAATAFAEGWAARGVRVRAYDAKTAAVATRAAKRMEYERLGVEGRDSAAAALAGAGLVLSLVTADQAVAAAREAAGAIVPGAIWCDMNSVAPETKRTAAGIVERAGGRYCDVAVMAPVHPRRRDVPLLTCGHAAEAGAGALRDVGFTDVRAVAGPVGSAAAIKMIRSVMVKGMEALLAECALAADAADVTGEVMASLDAGWPGFDWAGRGDYALDRMMVHGTRRAAEMEEAVGTLDALGTGSVMTRATVTWQRAIGALGLAPVAGLSAKIDAIRAGRDRVAA